jgi:hypothetical protein
MQSESSDAKYCIIGAGPCGLAQARAFLHRGVPFEILERHTEVGGLWDLTNPGSPMYETAHLISSKRMSGFRGYPMPDELPDYPKRAEVLDYLRSFAKRYDLTRHVKFQTNVLSVQPDAEGVEVVSSNGRRRYRGVVCATGINWTPNYATYPGTFSGNLRHSASYRHPREFEGKRLLIIGLGNSGAEIACDAVNRAQSISVSIRRGYYVLPKHIFGIPADEFAKKGVRLPQWLEVPVFQWLQGLLLGDTQKLGMPKPDHRVLECHPLVNDQLLHHLRSGNLRLCPDVERFDGSSVCFKDGTRKEFDEVLMCTGYLRTLPYLEERHLERDRSGISHVLSVFSRRYPTLTTLGFAEGNGALFPHADLLADLTAQFAMARASAPEQAARFRKLMETTTWNVSTARRLIDSQRHHGYCDIDALNRYVHRTFRHMGWAPATEQQWRDFS